MSSDMGSNAYQVYGLAIGFDPESLKTLHTQMVKKYHPDKPGGDRELFEKYQTAYETLNDPALRLDALKAEEARLFLKYNKPKPVPNKTYTVPSAPVNKAPYETSFTYTQSQQRVAPINRTASYSKADLFQKASLQVLHFALLLVFPLAFLLSGLGIGEQVLSLWGIGTMVLVVAVQALMFPLTFRLAGKIYRERTGMFFTMSAFYLLTSAAVLIGLSLYGLGLAVAIIYRVRYEVLRRRTRTKVS